MQHSTTPLELEIAVLSAESLVMPNKSKKRTSLLVSVHVDPAQEYESTWQSTGAVDVEKGETSATWNARLKAGVPMHGVKHVTFVVRRLRRSVLTGKVKSEGFGAASVPVRDLVAGHVARGCERLLSYRLRDRHGEANGIVNFSVRVRGLDWCGRTETGVHGWRRHQEVGGAGGVVVGIPVVWSL